MHPLTVLDWEYYHNTLREWLTALGLLLSVFAVLALARRVIGRRLRYAATRLQPTAGVDTLAADFVRRTRFLLLFALALGAASLELSLPRQVENTVRGFTILAVLLQAGIWGEGLITFGLQQYVARRSTPSSDGDGGAVAATRTTVAALGALARIILWMLLLLVGLDSLGVRVTALVAGLGVTGIALALAVQNILGDLFAALSIVMDKPFVVGDAITVDTLSGTVEHIGLKTTRVRAYSGEQIVFSNADLLKSRIRNFRRLHERTVTLTVLFDQSSPVDDVARVPGILRDIVEQQPGVRFGRSHVTTPTLTGIGVETVYTVLSPDYGQFMDVQQAITVALLRRLGDTAARLATSGGVTVVCDRPVTRDPARQSM